MRTCAPQVLASEVDAQKAVAPYLEHPLLRKIVQTFTNDPRGDFAQWATNPLVISMLEQASDLGKMATGRPPVCMRVCICL